MHVQTEIAPSFQQLRPLKETVTATFPVYKDLTETMATAKTHPDDTVAHVLATCAGYSYAHADTVAMIMARMGLEENHCRMIGQYVDAMFINSTAFLVQSRDGRVAVLSYRGTEPVNFVNWLTDFDVSPDTVIFRIGEPRVPYAVHAGFYRNVRSTRYEVVGALQQALEGRSVVDGRQLEAPLEALYITGHSLGGAMAAIMTLMLRTEPEYAALADVLRATYTFGAPMIGSPALASAANADPYVAEQLIRYVYRHDVVPTLPPWGTGDFAHFGVEYRYDGATWTRSASATGQMLPLGGLLLAAGDFVARQHRLLRLLPFPYSLTDHLPRHYVSTLTPPNSPTEFGDYFLRSP